MSIDGKLYPHVIEETRLKPGYIKTMNGTIGTLAELRDAMRKSLQ